MQLQRIISSVSQSTILLLSPVCGVSTLLSAASATFSVEAEVEGDIDVSVDASADESSDEPVQLPVSCCFVIRYVEQ